MSTTTTPQFFKDPDDVIDYTIDWTTWLEDTDTISSASFTVGSGLTKASESNTTTTATVWVSGGTIDTDYTATCRIVTVGGRTIDRSITITIKSR